MPTGQIGTAYRQLPGQSAQEGRPDGTWGPPRRTSGAPWTDLSGAVNHMYDLAGEIEGEENRRYQGGLAGLTEAYRASRETLGRDIDSSLLFSRAADAVGARARGNLDALRRSMGARGINPNSGAATALLQRADFEKQNALVGAERDIGIENQRRRDVNAAINFANALNLANYTNAPVSGVRLDATQNAFEGGIALQGIEAAQQSNRRANRTNLLGGLLGAGSSLLGGLLG